MTRPNTTTISSPGNPFPFRLNPPRRSAAPLRAQQGVVRPVAEQLWTPSSRAPARQRLQPRFSLTDGEDKDLSTTMVYTHVLHP